MRGRQHQRRMRASKISKPSNAKKIQATNIKSLDCMDKEEMLSLKKQWVSHCGPRREVKGPSWTISSVSHAIRRK
jgi:hypothetical protein